MIDWGNGQHKLIIGMTGTGKGHTTTNTLKSVPQGVFFFNTAHMDMPKGFVRATGKNELSDLMEDIEDGGKVNFLPARTREDAQKQLIAIINGLYSRKWKDFIFVIDEVHVLKKIAQDAIIGAITTARNYGVELACMSQRFQLVDKTIRTQSPYKVIFYLENETTFCEGEGIPYSDMLPKILEKDSGGINPKTGKYEPSHAYCTFFQNRVEGAFKYGST